jgi:hypothetical protein
LLMIQKHLLQRVPNYHSHEDSFTYFGHLKSEKVLVTDNFGPLVSTCFWVFQQ